MRQNNLGEKNPFYGKHHTVESKAKCGNKHQDGSQNPNWKGGVAKDRKFYNRHYQRARAQNLVLVGWHTAGDWENLKIQYGYRCPSCGKVEPDIKLTEDHIIPLSKGGSNYIENIQPLCMDCNHKKYTRIIKWSPNGEIELQEDQTKEDTCYS